jgi:succinate-semialdehyde dehydrogenase / glutarate-semialdehyde dehydrogenase
MPIQVRQVSPYDGRVVGTIASLGPQDVISALEASCRAKPALRRSTASNRQTVLCNLARALQVNSEQLCAIAALETGKPVRQLRLEVERVLSLLTNVMSGTKELNCFAKCKNGVALAIVNWCQPIEAISTIIVCAYLARTPVLIKPSSRAAITATKLELLWRTTGAESGAVQMLPTMNPVEVARVFLSDPRVSLVSFMGSEDVASHLRSCCTSANKRFMSADAGAQAVVVLPDGDLNAAAKGIIACTFLRNGCQDATCASRVFVHSEVAEPLLALICQMTSELKLGNPLSDGTDLGPVVDSVGILYCAEHVIDAEEKGATVVCGGLPTNGLFVAPTILDHVTENMRIVQEPRFGPILALSRFGGGEVEIEALLESYQTLTCSVWTRNPEDAKCISIHRGVKSIFFNKPMSEELSLSWIG